MNGPRPPDRSPPVGQENPYAAPACGPDFLAPGARHEAPGGGWFRKGVDLMYVSSLMLAFFYALALLVVVVDSMFR